MFGQGVTDFLPFCVFRFMKRENRLKLNRDFRRLYSKGKTIACGCVAVYAAKTKRPLVRVGLTVGKGVGNAVKRNRAKRLLRAAFDNVSVKISGGYDIIIVARNRIDGKTSIQVTRDLGKAFELLNMYEDKAVK